MATLDEILKEPAKFAADTMVPLSEVRPALEARESAWGQERAGREALERSIRLLNEPRQIEQPPATVAPAEPQEDPFEHDPYSRAILKRIDRTISERLENFGKEYQARNENTIRPLVDGGGALARLALQLKSTQDFSAFNDWPEGYTPERAFTEAVQRGLLERESRLPDIKGLHHVITEPTRLKGMEDIAYKKGLEEGIKQTEAKFTAQTRSRFQAVPRSNASRAVGADGKPAEDEFKGIPRKDRLQAWFDRVQITPEEAQQAGIRMGGF